MDADRPPPAATVAALTHRVPRRPDEARAFALAPDVWSLVLPLPYLQLRSVNAYLLALDGGLTLVDCGSSLPPAWEALELAVRRTGHDPAEIRRLICTHLHQDHAGLAATVAVRVGCELVRGAGPAVGHDAFRERLIPLEDRRRRARGEGVLEHELPTLIGPIIADDGRHQRASFDRVLRPGEVLDGRHARWEVIPAPGHSSAQCVLFDARRRWLISADLVGDVPMLEFGTMADPVALQLDSLDRVLALEASRMLPGHGRPVEGAEVRLGMLTARHALEAMVATARRALAAGPVTGYALSECLDPGNVDLEWRQSALSTSLCLLEHLESRGEAHASWDGDGVRRFHAGPGPR
jgi:glyoxylase-like metal-dependent hydrolase (beta-lactamase superfamily II)